MEKKNKVAHLIGTLNPGGAETLALALAANASRNALDMICIYRRSGSLESEFEKTGLSLFHLTPKGKWDVLYLYKLRKLLKRERVSVIHVHQVGDAVSAILATALSGIKVVYTLHGISYNKHKAFNGIVFGMKHADKLVFVSDFQKRFYIRDYRLNEKTVAKSAVVYNGVDFKINEEKSKKVELLLKSTDGKLILGTVGSFVSGRNQYFICQFLEKLHCSGVDFEFYFIGGKSEQEGYLFDNCQAFCEARGLSEKVHFMGVRSDVPSLLKQMDAFIYASVDDTFGIAVVEAIASGLPTFVNDWDVMKEITEDGQLAVIYKTDDLDDLQHLFSDFMANRKAYEEKAKANATIIRNKYGIDSHIESLKKVYSSI